MSSSSPLLAILLVTSSSSGSYLVWNWPSRPQTPIRLGRPRPIEWESEPDVSWRAAHDFDQIIATLPQDAQKSIGASITRYAKQSGHAEYEWQRPGAGEPRVISYPRSSQSRPGSGSVSPAIEGNRMDVHSVRDDHAYGEVLGYDPTFLAEVLSPKRALCHQKFELFVDELAFIGHPVHVRSDGGWAWDEAYGSPVTAVSQDQLDPRGRTKDRPNDLPDDISLSPEMPMIDPASLRSSSRRKRSTNAIRSFHLVLVLDRPDPSLVASSDLYKFVDVYYRQIAFKLTAAMHHEQGRSEFVAQQATLLSGLKDACIARSEAFESYVKQALDKSTLAGAIKEVFESISLNKIAQVNINDIPVQVQLPPNHASYFSGDAEELSEIQALNDFQLEETGLEDDDIQDRWHDEVQYGWRIPPLVPWKAILLLDGNGRDHVDSIWIGNPNSQADEEAAPKEVLRRFVEYASPTLSLSDIAALLDLDLQAEVYPMARLLVYNRKATVIDVIPSSLKNLYVPPAKFKRPIAEYAADFAKVFPHPVPPLPTILSKLSASHLPFSGIVPSSDHRPMFTEVLIWLLQRDLLIMLHVRIRIVATAEIKHRVWSARKQEVEARREQQREEYSGSDGSEDSPSPSHVVGGGYHQRNASDSPGIDITFEASSSPEVSRSGARGERMGFYRGQGRSGSESSDDPFDDDDDWEEEREFDGDDWEDWSNLDETIIAAPAKATPMERRWLEAMMEGKDQAVCRDFDRFCVFFDGKTTTDEILYRTDMSRRQLRDVLLQFDDCLITLLHA